MVVMIRLRLVVMTRLRLVVMTRLRLVVMTRLRLVVYDQVNLYCHLCHIINIYYSVTCYTNHINSTRIQSTSGKSLYYVA